MIDPLLATPIQLREDQFEDHVAFVRDGLLDPQARRENLCTLVPASLLSGMSALTFESRK